MKTMSDWGWDNVDPDQIDFDKLRKIVKQFEEDLNARGLPDLYVTTDSTYHIIRRAMARSHLSGISSNNYMRLCGVPVKLFSTYSECLNYIRAIKLRTILLR